ncbi:MAG: NUDIX domain-containing protein [Nanoarchaeota archaeon]|nr:NUDIX domain-containing protein [Nanoarchaeota archaeon]
MSLPTRLAVVCYFRRNDHTLFIDYTLTNHPIHKGKFSPTGGKVEKGETPEEAAKREAEEETNIITHKLVYRGKVLFRNERRTIDGKAMEYNWEVHFYDCHKFDYTQARASEGRLAWTRNDEVLDLPLHEGDKVIWERWLKDHNEFEGEIIHEGENLTSAKLLMSK